MSQKAFQDFYPEDFSHCYGCGQLNNNGLQIKSYWDNNETICRFTPDDVHIAFPGVVYGGLIASLIDCHCVGSAAAAMYRYENRDMESLPPIRCVTASLKVDFLAPTPLGVELELRGSIIEVTGKKAVIDCKVSAGETICATGHVVAVKMPDSMAKTVGHNI
jgi:acyl-coenzyme A thioesterase PaaI-like protein